MPFLGISPHTRLMLVAEALRECTSVATPPRSRRSPRGPRQVDQTSLHTLRLDQLRQAVRNNLVSFPSQVPVFERHDRPDLQRRIVQLYFILGWSCATIAARYGILRQRVGQVLSTWKRRALETGYIQYIPQAQRGFASARMEIVISAVAGDSAAAVAHRVRNSRAAL
jgi:hypothetical protein